MSRFYESCAQIEIDEYQSYAKALGAYQEAEKCLLTQDKDMRLQTIRRKIEYIGQFVQAQQYSLQKDVDQVHAICSNLLSALEIDSTVRIGDIYGLMVETVYASGDIPRAKDLLMKLASRLNNVHLEYYVDEDIVAALMPGRHADE